MGGPSALGCQCRSTKLKEEQQQILQFLELRISGEAMWSFVFSELSGCVDTKKCNHKPCLLRTCFQLFTCFQQFTCQYRTGRAGRRLARTTRPPQRSYPPDGWMQHQHQQMTLWPNSPAASTLRLQKCWWSKGPPRFAKGVGGIKLIENKQIKAVDEPVRDLEDGAGCEGAAGV